MGLRERNYRQTRQRIIAAARRLFDEHGYEATTIEMISEAAEVSPRTFHRYFEVKAGLATEPCARVIAEVADRVRRDWSLLDLVGAIGTAFDEGLASGDVAWGVRLHRENPVLLAETSVWRQRWAGELAHALATADGRTHPRVPDRVKAALAVHVAALAVDEWILRRPNEDYGRVLDEVQQAMCEHFDRALA